jgi:hypothetical protein
MPSFKTTRKIIIQENDYNVAYNFHFTENSSINSSDGFLPYDSTMVNVAVEAVTEDGTACSSLILSSGFSDVTKTVTVRLKWPNEGVGRYYLRFIITLFGNVTIEADYGRVFAENLP